MLESDALKKWCPLSRLSRDTLDHNANNRCKPSKNNPHGRITGTMCMGTMCMMWRELHGDENSPAQGYCGLAGKP